MTPQRFFYVPGALKWGCLGILFAGAVIGLAGTVYFSGERQLENHVLTAIALASASISTLLVAAVGLFSARSPSIAELRSQSAKFLREELPDILSSQRAPEARESLLKHPFAVEVRGEATSTDATYDVWLPTAPDLTPFTTHIYFNVRKAAVFFYISLEEEFGVGPDDVGPDRGRGDAIQEWRRTIQTVFDYEIRLATKRFDFALEELIDKEEIGDGPFFVFCFFKTLGEDFFETPAEQLMFGQDYGQLVRSFAMTVRRHGVRLARLPRARGAEG